MNMDKPADDFRFRDVVGLDFGPDYVLEVEFDDGAERTIDFEPILLGPLFGPLRDLHLFRQASVDEDLGTIVWPNGADIAPGVLYDWPQHVDTIVQRRRQRFAAETPVLLRGQQ
jgi:hypothetical protein